MFNYLPIKMQKSLQNLEFCKLQSIRIRANRPVVIEYNNKYLYLCNNGVFEKNNHLIIVSDTEIKEIFFNMCERSLYAYTDKICKGFISLEGGIRVGIGGECVVDDGKIINVKNISSLNIRIPHRIDGCSSYLLDLFDNGYKNMLVISPPGAGKTTIIRDFAEKISCLKLINVLVVDERGEIFPLISNGDTVDVISFSPKKFAYENGVRALAPNVIITDEIVGDEDFSTLLFASRCGVFVLATMHGEYENFLLNKSDYLQYQKFIDCFIFLSDKKQKGEIYAVLDKNFKRIR